MEAVVWAAIVASLLSLCGTVYTCLMNRRLAQTQTDVFEADAVGKWQDNYQKLFLQLSEALERIIKAEYRLDVGEGITERIWDILSLYQNNTPRLVNQIRLLGGVPVWMPPPIVTYEEIRNDVEERFRNK